METGRGREANLAAWPNCAGLRMVPITGSEVRGECTVSPCWGPHQRTGGAIATTFLTLAVFVRGAVGVFPEGSIVVPGVRSRISLTSEEQWHSLGIKIRGERRIGRLLR